MKQRIPLVVVAGPTASGKTDMAIHLAKIFDGEIINADSMQVYKELNIGSAKPSMEERQVFVPHHMMDVVIRNRTNIRSVSMSGKQQKQSKMFTIAESFPSYVGVQDFTFVLCSRECRFQTLFRMKQLDGN